MVCGEPQGCVGTADGGGAEPLELEGQADRGAIAGGDGDQPAASGAVELEHLGGVLFVDRARLEQGTAHNQGLDGDVGGLVEVQREPAAALQPGEVARAAEGGEALFESGGLFCVAPLKGVLVPSLQPVTQLVEGAVVLGTEGVGVAEALLDLLTQHGLGDLEWGDGVFGSPDGGELGLGGVCGQGPSERAGVVAGCGEPGVELVEPDLVGLGGGQHSAGLGVLGAAVEPACDACGHRGAVGGGRWVLSCEVGLGAGRGCALGADPGAEAGADGSVTRVSGPGSVTSAGRSLRLAGGWGSDRLMGLLAE